MRAARRGGEDLRGRVVLRMHGGEASPLVLEMAARIVATFRGELHGLFVENEELLALAQMPFAREISLVGGATRPLSLDIVRREMKAASAAMERQFNQLMRAQRISADFEVISGAAREPRKVMEGAGILAIGEPLALAVPGTFPEDLAELSGFAGLMVVGCEARRAHGPILAIIDPSSDVALLVDTAEQLAGESGEEVILVVCGAEAGDAGRLEARARAALDPGTRYRFERHGALSPPSLGALARQYGGGLVIGRIGGPLAADSAGAFRYACALDCPLLLLR